MTRLDQLDEIVRELAREELVARFRSLAASDILTKSATDGSDEIVTVADRAMERRLIPILEAVLPGSVVVGEEQTSADPARLDLLRGTAPVWVVDPLDGTQNFADGNPEFGVMLALVDRGEPVQALIHHPIRGTTLLAERGTGARLDGTPVTRARPRPRPVGAAYGRGLEVDRLRASRRLHATDALGSAASEYVSIAAGSRDFVVFASRVLPWDHVPGALAVRETGGIARLHSGRDYRATDRDPVLIVARDEPTWLLIRAAMTAA